MRFTLLLSAFLILNSVIGLAALPKDDDELIYIPKGTQLVNLKDINVPAGFTKIYFQNGLSTLDSGAINGNERYCFLLLKAPSTRDRIIEKDVVILTKGTYRSATAIVELEIAQPAALFDIGCLNGPKDIERKTTIGQFKTEISGVFEVVMPGPDPIK
ncbi:MAG: hypothetical protein ACKOA8_19595 [Deltaproteobacteria bacterium]